MAKVSSLSLFCCFLPLKMALWRYLKFHHLWMIVQSTMGWWRVTVAGLAGSLTCLSKMPHCVVVGCNNQVKKEDDPSVRFYCFPEKPELYCAWVNAVKRTTLPKDPRICSKHLECSYLMELQLMGSSRRKKALKPDVIPTMFPHKPAKPGHLSSVKQAEKWQCLEVSVQSSFGQPLMFCFIDSVSHLKLMFASLLT